MATGNPHWCQYQEVILPSNSQYCNHFVIISFIILCISCICVSVFVFTLVMSVLFCRVQALFHIGTTKSHPPIPEHLSAEAKDFLSKCLQKEPCLRASASELLQHPFVTAEYRESQHMSRRSVMENSGNQAVSTPVDQKSTNVMRSISGGLKDICNMGSVRCSTVYPEKFGISPLWGTSTSDDDMCIIDDKDDFSVGASAQQNFSMLDDFSKSFNPMCEPNDDWPCKLDDSPEVGKSNLDLFTREDNGTVGASCHEETEFAFPSEGLGDDDEEVTESKIRAFLDEKAFDLKKLQEEFYSTLNVPSPKAFGVMDGDTATNFSTKCKSPAPVPSRRQSTTTDVSKNVSPVHRPTQDMDGAGEQPLKELPEIRELQKEGYISSSERQRKWKEELDKELEMERERLAERLRQAGGTKTSSPNKRVPCQQRERLPFASSPK